MNEQLKKAMANAVAMGLRISKQRGGQKGTGIAQVRSHLTEEDGESLNQLLLDSGLDAYASVRFTEYKGEYSWTMFLGEDQDVQAYCDAVTITGDDNLEFVNKYASDEAKAIMDSY